MKVSYNNDIVTLDPNLKVTNKQPHANNNVKVTFTIPSGLTYVSSSPTKGTWSNSTKIWTIGTLAGNEEAIIKDFKLKVTNINNAPFSVTAVVSGDSTDNNSGNNTYSWLIEADTCAPAAGANPYISSCLCGTLNTTETTTVCSKGVTEWRLNPLSVTNGTVHSWDELTGEHDFQYIDDSQNITFTWNLYCVQGANEYLIAQNVPGTIRASIADKSVYDHVLLKRSYAELSAADILVLQEQHPGVILQDFCWEVIVNSNGDVTSGQPLNCDPEKNTKVTQQRLVANYIAQTPSAGVTFPENPEKGDMHIVNYANGTAYFQFNEVSWVPSFDNKGLVAAINVTGAPGNQIITMTLANGQIITSNTF